MLGLGRVLLGKGSRGGPGMDNQSARDEGILGQNLRQWDEAQSAENRWYAGQKLGHDPTPLEAFIHYTKNGGAEAFRHRQQMIAI